MNFRKLPLLGWLLVVTIAVGAFAQSVPPLVNYQGRLAHPDGSPFPTADYELRIEIWDAASNGTRIWGPQVFDGATAPGHGLRIPVVQGFFNVMLGPVDTNGRALSAAFAASNRYVEVTVGNRPPIQPRQQVLSTPFALQAAFADLAANAIRAANGSPPGTIVAFGGAIVPEGWILCDGRPLRSNDYPRLYSAIVANWGDASDDADPSTNFRAPDLRGLFLRGVDDSPVTGVAGRDLDHDGRTRLKLGGNQNRNVGSYQEDQFAKHVHYLWIDQNGDGDAWGISAAGPAQVEGGHSRYTEVAGGSETRPKNAYVNYIIKY